MLKTQKIVLLPFVIFLVSCSSCKSFKWEPQPYVGDSVNLQLVNAEGETVMCDQPSFERMTCFDEENIAELKSAIDRINTSKKTKAKFKNLVDRTFIR